MSDFNTNFGNALMMGAEQSRAAQAQDNRNALMPLQMESMQLGNQQTRQSMSIAQERLQMARQASAREAEAFAKQATAEQLAEVERKTREMNLQLLPLYEAGDQEGFAARAAQLGLETSFQDYPLELAQDEAAYEVWGNYRKMQAGPEGDISKFMTPPASQPQGLTFGPSITGQPAPQPQQTGAPTLSEAAYRRILATGDPAQIERAQRIWEAQQNDAPTTKTVKRADGSEVVVEWNSTAQGADGQPGAWVPIDAPQGGKVVSDRQDLSEGEAKMTLFSSMQTETAPVLDAIEELYDPANIQDAAARSTPLAGNFFQTSTGQQYQAAASAWSEGALRLATGAAATPEEFQRTINTYFAQVGDTPATIQFKSKMREMYSRAIRRAMGETNVEGTLPTPMEFAETVDAPSTAGQPTGEMRGDRLDRRGGGMSLDIDGETYTVRPVQ